MNVASKIHRLKRGNVAGEPRSNYNAGYANKNAAIIFKTTSRALLQTVEHFGNLNKILTPPQDTSLRISLSSHQSIHCSGVSTLKTQAYHHSTSSKATRTGTDRSDQLSSHFKLVLHFETYWTCHSLTTIWLCGITTSASTYAIWLSSTSLHENSSHQSVQRHCHGPLALDSGFSTALLLPDISFAFDCVDHCILLKVLQLQFHVTASALQWISSFLASRSHSVKLSGSSSKICSVLLGVPRGSIHGPLLFILYASNIVNIAS